MTLRASVVFQPWDILDGDTTALMDKLHGEIGITGVSVRFVQPQGAHFRVQEVTPRTFRTRGGFFFQPDDVCYQSTRCKPILSSWVRGRNTLDRVSDACANRGMDLRVIITATRNTRLVLRHPEMAAKSVFGDVSSDALCLANPDVKAYLHGLVTDLSNRSAVQGVVVEDLRLSWSDLATAQMFIPHAFQAIEQRLCSICFCESCRQGATACGVDVQEVAGFVKTFLQQALNRGQSSGLTMRAVLAENPAVSAWLAWSAKELSGLWTSLREAAKCELVYSTQFQAEDGTPDEWPLLGDDVVLTSVLRADDMNRVREKPGQRRELRLCSEIVLEQQGPELVRTLSRAVELGFAGVEFEHFGQLPESAWTPIKQAIRFARRAASI